MNRRNILKASSIAAATVISGKALANKHHKKSNTKHPYGKVLQSTEDCITTGAICHQHCVESLISGSTSMKDCIVAVENMLVACEAMQKFSAQKSKFAKSLAKLCIQACEECAEACKPHRSHHQECRDCYEACLDCIKACKTLI